MRRRARQGAVLRQAAARLQDRGEIGGAVPIATQQPGERRQGGERKGHGVGAHARAGCTRALLPRLGVQHAQGAARVAEQPARQGAREPRSAAAADRAAHARMLKRRSWLFVPGADVRAHAAAARSGADVIILELEDFTPPDSRPKARALAARAFDLWRKAGAAAAVRINPLEADGLADLKGVLPARPDMVLMSKVA